MGSRKGALCLALSWGVHGSKGNARGFGMLVSEHGAIQGPAKWIRRVMGLQDPMLGMLSYPTPIPTAHLQDPILRVLSSPNLTPHQSCGHWSQLCLVISLGVSAWLPGGDHSPAGVTRDLLLGLLVWLQPRPQPACGFRESPWMGREGTRRGPGGSCSCCSRELPAAGESGVPMSLPMSPPAAAMDDIFTQCREGNAVAVRLWLDNTENDLNQG